MYEQMTDEALNQYLENIAKLIEETVADKSGTIEEAAKKAAEIVRDSKIKK